MFKEGQWSQEKWIEYKRSVWYKNSLMTSSGSRNIFKNNRNERTKKRLSTKVYDYRILYIQWIWTIYSRNRSFNIYNWHIQSSVFVLIYLLVLNWQFEKFSSTKHWLVMMEILYNTGREELFFLVVLFLSLFLLSLSIGTCAQKKKRKRRME